MEQTDNDSILHRYEQAIAEGKSIYADAQDILRIADYYRRSGTPQQKLQVIEYGLTLHPDDEFLKIEHAIQLSAMDRFDGIERYLEEIEAFAPESAVLKIPRAAWLARTGRLPEAMLLFNNAVEEHSNAKLKSNTAFQAGCILMDAKHYAEAVRFFNTSLDLVYDEEAVFLLGCCHAFLGEFHKATKLYKKMLKDSPYAVNAWFNLGNMYIGLGKFEKAVDAFEFTLAIEPDREDAKRGCAHAYFQTGTALFKKNNAKEALVNFRKAYEQYPDTGNLTYCMAAAHFKLREYISSVRFLKEAADKAEDKWGEVLSAFAQTFPDSLRMSDFYSKVGYGIECKGVELEDEIAYMKGEAPRKLKQPPAPVDLPVEKLPHLFHVAVAVFRLEGGHVKAAGLLKETLKRLNTKDHVLSDEEKESIINYFITFCPNSLLVPGFFKEVGFELESSEKEMAKLATKMKEENRKKARRTVEHPGLPMDEIHYLAHLAASYYKTGHYNEAANHLAWATVETAENLRGKLINTYFLQFCPGALEEANSFYGKACRAFKARGLDLEELHPKPENEDFYAAVDCFRSGDHDNAAKFLRKAANRVPHGTLELLNKFIARCPEANHNAEFFKKADFIITFKK
ncbi:putative O-linked N-acetylglucosamine transferase, SPINDLY family [Bacteroidales bacterium Barb4]|nr:putative O-linked N-acetylglucosamine transferase, SPINDLY family [Bacteroidales bacterium Barb4]